MSIIGSALDLLEMTRSRGESIRGEDIDNDALYLLKTQIFVERNWEEAESLLSSLSVKKKEALKRQLQQEIDTICLLHYAVSAGGTEGLIVALLELNPQMFASYVDQHGDLPIHAAVRRGLSVPVICALIEANEASLKKKDRFGSLPLHISIINGKNMNLITFLLDRYQRSASIANDNGDLPLHLAIKQDKATLEAIEALVKLNSRALTSKDSTGRVPLLLAIAYDKNVPIISSLINSSRRSARLKSDDGNLPVHAAVRWKKSLPIIVALVDSYAKGLEEPDGSGRLPLQTAIENKSDSGVLEYLIELYPRAASIPNADGDLPLVSAIAHNAPISVVSKLIGANRLAVLEPNASAKMFPLDIAIERNAGGEIISLILEEYARNISSCNDPPSILRRKGVGGDLPLHSSLRYEVPTAVVLRLVDNCKSSCRFRGKFGELPLHIALRGLSTETLAVIGVILAFPQALNIPTTDGDLASALIDYETADEVLIRAVELPVEFWSSMAQNLNELEDCDFCVEVEAIFAMLQKNPSIRNGYPSSKDIEDVRVLQDEVEVLRQELDATLNGLRASTLHMDADGEY
mmetsp:Transcript_5073/g.7440  ORF Transcript_5073/g.7440 Transcript_5073/m.7440 type:complete len:578 (-) Transcript_5073:6482-8215(-)